MILKKYLAFLFILSCSLSSFPLVAPAQDSGELAKERGVSPEAVYEDALGAGLVPARVHPDPRVDAARVVLRGHWLRECGRASAARHVLSGSGAGTDIPRAWL